MTQPRIRSVSSSYLFSYDEVGETMRTIVALATHYRVGAIIDAEKAIDEYLDEFQGDREYFAALDKLLHEITQPDIQDFNRGGLFEQARIYIGQRQVRIKPKLH